jgi:hypothetical protein
MRTETLNSARRTWQEAIDPGLVRRLLRPCNEPGVISMRTVRRILGFLEYLEARIALFSRVAQRWANVGQREAPDHPIVYALWITDPTPAIAAARPPEQRPVLVQRAVVVEVRSPGDGERRAPGEARRAGVELRPPPPAPATAIAARGEAPKASVARAQPDAGVPASQPARESAPPALGAPTSRSAPVGHEESPRSERVIVQPMWEDASPALAPLVPRVAPAGQEGSLPADRTIVQSASEGSPAAREPLVLRRDPGSQESPRSGRAQAQSAEQAIARGLAESRRAARAAGKPSLAGDLAAPSIEAGATSADAAPSAGDAVTTSRAPGDRVVVRPAPAERAGDAPGDLTPREAGTGQEMSLRVARARTMPLEHALGQEPGLVHLDDPRESPAPRPVVEARSPALPVTPLELDPSGALPGPRARVQPRPPVAPGGPAAESRGPLPLAPTVAGATPAAWSGEPLGPGATPDLGARGRSATALPARLPAMPVSLHEDAPAQGLFAPPAAGHPAAPGAANVPGVQIDIDSLADQVQRKLLRQLSLESERRGIRR